MSLFAARPAVVERTRTPAGHCAVTEFDGSLSESGFGLSIPTPSAPDAESQLGGGRPHEPAPTRGGGCACGFD